MKKRKWMIMITAAGLIATTTAVGANGLMKKVTGFLDNDVMVSINGTDTTIQPVYIDGKAYFPARDTANALGYSLNWSRDQIELVEKESEMEEFLQTSGVIVSVEPIDDRYRLEVLGHGPNTWIILYADKETVLTNAAGDAFAAKDLKAGMHITAQYGPIIAFSFPGQSHAASIQVGDERLIKEEAILSVDQTDDGWQIQFGEMKDGAEAPELTLNAGKETMLVTPEGYPVEWSQIKAGTKVRAYYGPIMTKSIPPQSPADVIVVLDGLVDPTSVNEYRELAWTFVPESEKEHLITKQENAQVDFILAKGAAIVPADDKQKEILADIQSRDGKLITVTYNTDQDALLGPLMIVIHPETKELIGFFQRL
ncbi:hypothetical protein [Paenibacillus abyssi]|uniref:Copper amine oxidase-like N-terminal domain-containing protein n=1 Tax=Paenibacillus abyssi TaxID=1340531 RepID=A0A917D4C9_9BACL|nr:hypothetical protein [Paenibacillus abyssi]GGG11241.1 hypothetical protein GCM10010916_30100 [Paenibacillus abyssi]